MKEKKNNGFSSLEVLVTLFVLSLLIIAFLYIFSFYQLSVTKEKKIYTYKQNIELCFTSLIETFKEQINLDNDGPNDNIYSIESDTKTNCQIKITPLSGRIDLNYLPLEFFQTPFFASLLKEGTSFSFIEEFRTNGKLITSYSQIEEFIDEEKFNQFFTLHSTANINIADETSLLTLCNLYDLPSEIINKRRILIKNKQFVSTEPEALLSYGINYQTLNPYINTQPILNVNFIDENFLRTLVSLPRFKQTAVDRKCSTIISARDSVSLNKELISNTFGISKSNELYYYLGCNTYFWEILITNETVSCKYTVFRNDKDFYLIEKKWI